MVVDQEEIDKLLAQAGDLVSDVESTESDAPAAAPQASAAAPSMGTLVASGEITPEVGRILRIRVPLIVQLAARRMNVEGIRQMSLGMIIEFDKSVEDPLDLLVNNRPVGKGEAVKVGENFGVRVTDVSDKAQRIQSLGG